MRQSLLTPTKCCKPTTAASLNGVPSPPDPFDVSEFYWEAATLFFDLP